ncbi:MAG: hypothetical protein AB7E47_01870 [Desulfovibrionaceae bacterium]
MRTLLNTLILPALAIATLLAAPQPVLADDGLNATLATLNQSLGEVESLSDYGGGFSSYYKKKYVFEAHEGFLIIGEAYVGENRDNEGVNMQWDGRYVYRIEPAKVTLGAPDYANEFFEIQCPGRAQCIEYRSIDASTWSRGQSKSRPLTTGGLMNSIKIQAGKDNKRLKSAHAYLSHVLGQMRTLVQ